MKRGGFPWKTTLAFFIVIILIIAIYFTFFFKYSCDDLECFRSHQIECAKTKFVNDAPETTWEYKILGKEDGKCQIAVEVLKVKTGSLENRRLEGKNMICDLNLGSQISPEADTSLCHG